MGDGVIREFGWLQWAAQNDMIVVAPQTKWSTDTNIAACWSTMESMIGDKNYWNNEGVQQKAFKKMFERVLAKQDKTDADFFTKMATEDLYDKAINPPNLPLDWILRFTAL